MPTSADDPRYLPQQIADWVRSAVANGDLGPGDRVPPSRELMERFKVSTQTAQNAIHLLKEYGLVDTVRGRGTFVRSDVDPEQVGRLLLAERVAGRGDPPAGVSGGGSDGASARELEEIRGLLAQITAGMDRIERRVEALEAERPTDPED